MIRTWKCLLGAWAVCAILCRAGYSQVIEIDEVGVARMQPPATAPRPADVLYSDAEPVWLNDFQPPPGVGVDPVTIPEDNGVGYAVTSDVAEILYRIQRTNRHFHGLDDDGFTSAGAFVPLQVFDNGNALFAVDPRAFVSDNGRGGLNLGATFRRYSPRLRRVLVFSNWLDYDRAGQAGYAQYGLHAATIGEYWSLRANLNLPVGQSHEFYDRAFSNVGYEENFLVLSNNAKLETAYQRLDVEFSLPIPYFARFGFEYGLGAYYLNGAFDGVQDSAGISTRVEAQVTEDLWANALMTSDDVFGSNLSLNLEITLPDGAPARIMRRLPIKQYMVQSDKRTYRVIRGIENRPERELAISTAPDFAGDPIFIAHIDPNATDAGDGTFENPFQSIEQLESLADADQDDYELILVRGREDGTDTNLNTTVTLFNGQRLLGDGVDHFVDAVQGTFLLPGFGTPTPLLTNSGDDTLDVIRLANRNEVSGFDIDASGTARAINGLNGGAGISGFNINRNSIDNTTTGVELAVSGNDDGFFADNSVTGAIDDGVVIGVDGGVFDMTDGIVDNVVTGNGGNGFVIRNLGGGDIDVSGVADNDFSDNGDAGFLVDGNGSLAALFLDVDLGDVVDNDFSRTESGTIGFEVDTENTLITATFQNNDFSADTAANTDANRGVGGRVGGTGGVDFTFGPITNLFDGNADAHIGLVLDEDTDNSVVIEGHEFSNAVDGSNALFNGEGVSLLVRQRADLEGSVTSSLFEDNAAAGLNINVNGNSFPDFARVTSFAVGGPTVADGNIFRNNGGDGLAFIRTGNGQVGSTSAVLIQNNLFDSNLGNGFRIDTGGTASAVDQYDVLNNVSIDNFDAGLQLFVRADAQMDVDMDQNVFDGNLTDGVRLNEQVNDISDLRALSGTWTRNDFTNNGRHGISLDGGMDGLLIGDLVDDDLGNLIAFNNNDGISITGPGSLTIARNVIAENGSNTAGAGDNDAGVDISSQGSLFATIFHNDIINNNGDGIESETIGVFGVTLDVNENFIAFNDGRGFDLLARSGFFEGFHGSFTDVDFHDNVINENGEEGVYVVLTASDTQTQDLASTVALQANGDASYIISDIVQLRFDMTGNQILGNGRLSGFTSTGLVVRIGTTGSSSAFGAPFNTGDFVSNGVSVDSPFINTGAIMRVANNNFGGNFGDDVYFESFTSTVDPDAATGTWSDTEFTLDDYRGDPLARLDLHWSNNTYDSTDVTNVGAYYDNADGTFKSRTAGATDPGPFPNGADGRRRNAQRIPARLPFVTDPTTPGGLSDQFLYPGMGPSSFRIRGNLLQINSDGFILDTFPYNDTGDANGLFYPGILNQMPWGWGYIGP